MQLDHVTLRTRNIPATRDFFIKLFGMMPGERPAQIQRIPGCWLYSEGHPLVHIIGSFGSHLDCASEAIDHVGFRLNGYADFRSRLERLDIRYSTMDLADIQERRLFFRAPGGPLLEAVFAEPISAGDVNAPPASFP
ncbi:glyoxalase [Ochrobactrum pecoris]|uniref:Catechol 2,3-dioxygenase-like lactoylglutathione lyase family enzyme n=1 Tax=Brucella pecoris TaxID=867683 RepID=A0A5C5CGK8_9HYPH|nr:glyoxalase [Brucella pecoris]MBB4095297.1 catechol 2,3-dioxygenase-like lactoylglutathione lyase family enzyme [Brucella pecoris]NKW81590.1 glyoxalase [Brucella pecoris]TNV10493.1 glyoxalase [Brucella pecoris]